MKGYHSFFFKILLFTHERHTEAETQAEGEAGSLQGAQRGTRSQDPGVTPWAAGNTKPLSPPGCPPSILETNVPNSGKQRAAEGEWVGGWGDWVTGTEEGM